MSLLLSRRGILSQIVSDTPDIEFVSSSITANASGTTVVVTKPTGLANGDVMIAHVFANSSGNPSGPAGWTLVHSQDNITTRDIIWYKVVTDVGSEPANYTFTTGNSFKTGSILAYRGVSNNNPIATFANTVASGTSMVAPAVTTIRDGSMILVTFGHQSNGALSDPAGLTMRVSDDNSTAPNAQVGEVAQAVAGTTTTYTSTAGVSGFNNARQIVLNKAAASEVAFVSAEWDGSNGASTTVVPKPTGTIDGDLMVMAATINNETTTPPAGWTLLQSELGNPAWYVWYKVAASEGSTYTLTHSANADSIVGIVTYRNTRVGSPIDASFDLYSAASLATIDVPDGTSTVANALALHIGGQKEASAMLLTAHPNTVSRIEAESVTGILAILGISDELLGAAGAVTGRDWTMSSAKTARYGALVILAPA